MTPSPLLLSATPPLTSKKHDQNGKIEGKDLGLDLSLNESVSVAVQLKLCDGNLRGVDRNKNSGTVGLVASDLLDVNRVLLSVHLNNFAFTAGVRTADDTNFIILADRKAADLTSGSEHKEQNGEK